MRFRKLFFFAALTAFLCTFPAFCQDLEKEFKREFARYHIRPNQVRSLKRDSNGAPVSDSDLEHVVRIFYEQLYLMDPGFLKHLKVKEVVFKDTVLDFDGKRYQHRLLDGILFLNADLGDNRFYTNMFYLLLPDMPRSYLTRWNKLNPDGFTYEYSRGTLSGQAQKKLNAVLADWVKRVVDFFIFAFNSNSAILCRFNHRIKIDKVFFRFGEQRVGNIYIGAVISRKQREFHRFG